jgi:hypothetical protein
MLYRLPRAAARFGAYDERPTAPLMTLQFQSERVYSR